MKLYHGSNIVIQHINLTMCRPYKDFGKGFYLMDIEEQAKKMAVRVSKIYGGSPVVNTFEIQDDFREIQNLKIKDFGVQTIEEWTKFVMHNRNRAFLDMKNNLCKKIINMTLLLDLLQMIIWHYYSVSMKMKLLILKLY